ncbi:MAG: hypothetical protein GQ574_05535 [Crocinitomix sp.]|nr:hypothetical protein [Crocinitomix sp.]
MDLKNFSFSCPFCKHLLNDSEEIELVTKRDSGTEGRIFMSVAFGNYTFRHIPETNFTLREIVDFLCPHCQTDLKAPNHKNFAQLNMDVGHNISFDVIFSREAGKRKTYVITEDGIETYQG